MYRWRFVVQVFKLVPVFDIKSIFLPTVHAKPLVISL